MLVLPWLRGSPPHCPLPPPRTSLTVEVKAFYSKLAWKFPFSLFWHHPAGWVGSPCYSLARLLGSTGVGLGLWCSTGVMWLSPEKHWVFLSSFLFFFFSQRIGFPWEFLMASFGISGLLAFPGSSLGFTKWKENPGNLPPLRLRSRAP